MKYFLLTFVLALFFSGNCFAGEANRNIGATGAGSGEGSATFQGNICRRTINGKSEVVTKYQVENDLIAGCTLSGSSADAKKRVVDAYKEQRYQEIKCGPDAQRAELKDLDVGTVCVVGAAKFQLVRNNDSKLAWHELNADGRIWLASPLFGEDADGVRTGLDFNHAGLTCSELGYELPTEADLSRGKKELLSVFRHSSNLRLWGGPEKSGIAPTLNAMGAVTDLPVGAMAANQVAHCVLNIRAAKQQPPAPKPEEKKNPPTAEQSPSGPGTVAPAPAIDPAEAEKRRKAAEKARKAKEQEKQTERRRKAAEEERRNQLQPPRAAPPSTQQPPPNAAKYKADERFFCPTEYCKDWKITRVLTPLNGDPTTYMVECNTRLGYIYTEEWKVAKLEKCSR